MPRRPGVVLIVDDCVDGRRLLKSMLSEEGYAILEAGDGEQALALAAQADLVLLDVKMPGMGGLEACRRLRRAPATRFLPIVLVTGLEAPSDRLAGIEAGADDFLTKPVDRTQLTARVRALMNAKRERDDAERLKADFTSMIVHDLRSPLTSIIGFTELLADDLPSGQRQEFAGHVIGSARQMLQMINDLLDLSRLESERMPRRLKAVQPRQVLQDAVARMRPLATGRHLALGLDAPDELPVLVADERQLGQVLTNLLDNAVKFARYRVDVVARQEDGQLRITVDDDGPGVPEADWPRLFERWHQTEVGRKSGKGSGLGLAIARRLVELHAGTLSPGRSEQGGLRMTVSLPLSGPPATPA